MKFYATGDKEATIRTAGDHMGRQIEVTVAPGKPATVTDTQQINALRSATQQSSLETLPRIPRNLLGTDWSHYGGPGSTGTLSASTEVLPASGDYTLKYVAGAASSHGQGIVSSSAMAVEPLTTYQFTAKARPVGYDARVYIIALWWNNGTILSSGGGSYSACRADAWTEITHSAVSPYNATHMSMYVSTEFPLTTGDVMHFDSMAAYASDVPLGFFDGDHVEFTTSPISEYRGPEVARNKISSPSFELNADSWYPYENGLSTVTITRTAGIGRNGSYGLRVQRTAGTGAYAGAMNNSHLFPNTGGIYAMWAWVKGTAGATGEIFADWNRGAGYEQASAGFTFTGDWQRVGHIFVVPPGTMAFSNIYIWRHNTSTGQFFDIDSVQLTPITNLVSNWNFDTNVRGWSNSHNGWLNAGATVSRSTTEFRSGSGSLAIALNNIQYSGASYLIHHTFKAGKTYWLGFYSKAAAGIYNQALIGTTTDYAVVGDVMNGSWLYYAVPWTPAADASNAHLVFRQPGPGWPQTGTIYVDQITVADTLDYDFYFDGSEWGEWMGPEHGSESVLYR